MVTRCGVVDRGDVTRVTAELCIRGVDRLTVEYRRWLFEVVRGDV
jgi:hypothetical protein